MFLSVLQQFGFAYVTPVESRKIKISSRNKISKNEVDNLNVRCVVVFLQTKMRQKEVREKIMRHSPQQSENIFKSR